MKPTRILVVDDEPGMLRAIERVLGPHHQVTTSGSSTQALELAAALGGSWRRLGAVTAAMFASGDIEAAMANSAVYLEAFGHIVIAWMWLEQFLAAGDQPGDFYDGKRQAARYFFRYELPRTLPQLQLLESLDRTTLDMRPAWF